MELTQCQIGGRPSGARCSATRPVLTHGYLSLGRTDHELGEVAGAVVVGPLGARDLS